ncbi:TPA: hypothetical protein ACKP8A_004435 [Stenotrophomonas maltophilia]
MDIFFTSSPTLTTSSTLGLSSTDWIALSSAFIALIALVYSVYQGRLQRRHQILSAKPILEFHVSNGDTLLLIRNEGFGPASIVSFRAAKEGQVIDMTTGAGIKQFVALATSGINEDFRYERTRFDSGTVFGVGKEVSVVTSRDHLSDASRMKITENLSRLKLSISYKCIYGETYSTEATFEQVVEADSAICAEGHPQQSATGTVPSVPKSG